MKKKVWIVVIITTVIIMGLYFWWPRPLDKVLDGDGRLSVIDGDSLDVVVYELNSGDEEFAEIKKTFEGYSCNIDLRSLLPGKLTGGGSIYLTFIVPGDDGTVKAREIVVQDSGYIEIDGEFFRCRKASELMEEIREVLKDVEPES